MKTQGCITTLDLAMTPIRANQLGSHTMTHQRMGSDIQPHLPEGWASHVGRGKIYRARSQESVTLGGRPAGGTGVQEWFFSLLWVLAKRCPRVRTLKIRLLDCMLVTRQFKELKHSNPQIRSHRGQVAGPELVFTLANLCHPNAFSQ